MEANQERNFADMMLSYREKKYPWSSPIYSAS